MDRFTATLERNERGGTKAEIPFDVAAAFGSVRAPVLATINGFTFRTRTMRYGGVYLLGVNREAREGAGVEAGDMIAVALELDEAPREVDVPRELTRALETEPELRSFFDSLSYTHRVRALDRRPAHGDAGDASLRPVGSPELAGSRIAW